MRSCRDDDSADGEAAPEVGMPSQGRCEAWLQVDIPSLAAESTCEVQKPHE